MHVHVARRHQGRAAGSAGLAQALQPGGVVQLALQVHGQPAVARKVLL